MKSRSTSPIRTFFKKALIFLSICFFLTAVLVSLVIVWTFEVKFRRWPMMVFGAPESVRVGDNLGDLQLYNRLARLGYSRSESLAPNIGQWGRSGSDFKIFLRYSPFVGDGPIEGPVTLLLDDDTIKSIRLMRSLQEVRSFQLEPELLGVIPVKGGVPEMVIPVPLSRIPSSLIDSILLTEDNRFYSHSGVDLISMYRALVSNIQAGRYVQGGSTITQQLIRMTLLNPEKTLWRKFLEIVLSLGADAIYSKKTILEAYLNRVYLGHFGLLPVLGVAEASRNFFGKSPEQLDVSESALIAAIIRAPNVINPFRHPQRTLTRRNMILGLLFKHGKISRDAYEEAIAKPVQMLKPGASPPRVGSFIDILRQKEKITDSSSNPYQNYISTSLDPAIQAGIEVRLRKLGESGQQSFVVLTNPSTGSLKVYVTPSSEKWDGRGGNLALFSPMALTPALKPQKVNDPIYTIASQITFSDPKTKKLAFAEAFRTDREELLRKIIEVIGVDKIISALKEFRIDAVLGGGSEILIEPMTPLEVAQSYAILSGLGSTTPINCRRPPRRNSPTPSNSESKIGVSTPPSVLFIINSLLREQQNLNDVNESPKTLLLSPSVLSSFDNMGAWSVAYNRNALVVLRFPPSHLSSTDLRSLALDSLPRTNFGADSDFAIPAGLVFRKLCAESGLRATSTCPQVTLNPFLSGTQPDEWCSLRHQAENRTGPPQKRPER